MVLSANLCGNALYAVPGGYPVTLWRGGCDTVVGVIPKGATTLTATVASVPRATPTGTGVDATDNAPTAATVRLRLFYAPASSTAADGAAATDEVSIEGLTATAQDLAVEIPTGDGIEPAVCVFRLWVETIGTNGVRVDSIEVA